MFDQSPDTLNWAASAETKIKGGTFRGTPYTAPDAAAPLADSMTKWWRRLEYLRPLPKAEWISHVPRQSFLGRIRPPIFQPRHIPTEHALHESVLARRTALQYEPEPVKDYLRRRPDVIGSANATDQP